MTSLPIILLGVAVILLAIATIVNSRAIRRLARAQRQGEFAAKADAYVQSVIAFTREMNRVVAEIGQPAGRKTEAPKEPRSRARRSRPRKAAGGARG